MPLFAKGASVEDFGRRLSISIDNSLNPVSLAQLLTKPATYFYGPGRDPAPSAVELFEKSYGLSVTHEQMFLSDVRWLLNTKPEERKLRPIHETAATFFGNTVQSLIKHNVATLAQTKGESRAATRYRREGIAHETAALKVVMKLIIDLGAIETNAPQLYAKLGISEPHLEAFMARFPRWRTLNGAASMWDVWDEED